MKFGLLNSNQINYKRHVRIIVVKYPVAASSFFRLSPEHEREREKSERNAARRNKGIPLFATLRISKHISSKAG